MAISRKIVEVRFEHDSSAVRAIDSRPFDLTSITSLVLAQLLTMKKLRNPDMAIDYSYNRWSARHGENRAYHTFSMYGFWWTEQEGRRARFRHPTPASR